jgi:hypothetical protein
MESDFTDPKNPTMASPKQEDPPDLASFLSVLKSHIEDATTKMASDFHQVLLRMIFSKRRLSRLMTNSRIMSSKNWIIFACCFINNSTCTPLHLLIQVV